MLCCVICLNLCSGRALEGVHEELFRRWPTALHMAIADRAELEGVLSVLGLKARRATALIRMSVAWALLWDGEDPADLPGIGRYGSDSYRVFVRGEIGIPVTDKEVKKYLQWRNQRDSG